MAEVKERRCRPVTTVLTPSDFVAFKKIAKDHGATPSALMRGIIIDLIAEQIETASKTVVAADGCEETTTPNGHTFYNATDWY